MTTAQFFEKFDLIADAPDAVAHLRDVVYSVGIAADKWPQEPLESVALKVTDGTHQTPRYVETGIPFVSVKDFSGGSLDMTATRFITPEEHSVIYKRCDPKRGDILLGRIGTIGKAVVVDTDIEFSLFVSAAQIRPDCGKILSRYLQYVLNSPFCRAQFDNIKVGGATHTNKLNLKDLRSVQVPIPPLAEQKRIVAKVDELMALCDELQAQQQERETKHTALAQATLARFAEAPTPTNLNLLFHSSFSTQPSDLRKTILTLAVQGKLVPQDPNDETLPKTFAGLKIQDETMENAPSGWACLAYRDLTTLVTSGSRGWKQYYSSQGAIFVRTQNIKTDRLILDDVAYVDLPASTEGKRSQILPSDILITITGANVTKAARIETSLPEAYVSQHIALTRPKWESMSPWLHLCFVSPTAARGELERLAYGDKPGLNLDNIRNLRFPIPPLAEQKRIVAKVEELMALVDALEAQQAAADQAATHLLDAVVSELAAAA